MAQTVRMKGELHERVADMHSTFTIERPVDSDDYTLVAASGPLMWAFIDITFKKHIEDLPVDGARGVSRIIEHLSETFSKVLLFWIDEAGEQQPIRGIAFAPSGSIFVIYYREDEDVIDEVYRGPLGRQGLVAV